MGTARLPDLKRAVRISPARNRSRLPSRNMLPQVSSSAGRTLLRELGTRRDSEGQLELRDLQIPEIEFSTGSEGERFLELIDLFETE